MGSNQRLALFLAVTSMLSSVAHPKTCKYSLRRLKVKRNFDLEKFLERWNVFMSVSSDGFESDTTTDAYHMYRRSENGDILGYFSGRDATSRNCVYVRFRLQETEKEGVLRMLVPGEKPVLYYVLSTDYKRAHVYACYDYNAQETVCNKGKAWLLTRDREGVPIHVQIRWLNKNSRMCLDTGHQLKSTKFTRDDPC